jgi:hypothetical protein
MKTCTCRGIESGSRTAATSVHALVASMLPHLDAFIEAGTPIMLQGARAPPGGAQES